jgi:hypothetical protein
MLLPFRVCRGRVPLFRLGACLLVGVVCGGVRVWWTEDDGAPPCSAGSARWAAGLKVVWPLRDAGTA